MSKTSPKSPTAENRKAHFDLAVEQTLEAGLRLTSSEIKSIRANRIQLTGAYVKFLGGEPVVIAMHLAQADEPERTRPLLLHKKEIMTLKTALQNKGLTVVPLKLYLKRGWAKLLLGVGPGRKTYQKRQLLRERDLERQAGAELKQKYGR